MKLIRPKKIANPAKSGPFQGAVEMSHNTTYSFEENGLSVTKPIEVFYKGTPINTHQVTIPVVLSIPNESVEQYHFFQNGMNYCTNNAEMLNNRLRDFMLNTKTTTEAKAEIYAKDFMGLRDAFSKYINEDKSVRGLEQFNTKLKRKEVTSTFNEYILDRNIYIHGKLKLLLPDGIFFIDYVEEKKTQTRVEMTKEVIQSFMDVSIALKNYLAVAESNLQKQKLSSQ